MPCFLVEIEGYSPFPILGYEIIGDGEDYRLVDSEGNPLALESPHVVRQLNPEPVADPPWYSPP